MQALPSPLISSYRTQSCTFSRMSKESPEQSQSPERKSVGSAAQQHSNADCWQSCAGQQSLRAAVVRASHGCHPHCAVWCSQDKQLSCSSAHMLVTKMNGQKTKSNSTLKGSIPMVCTQAPCTSLLFLFPLLYESEVGKERNPTARVGTSVISSNTEE